MERFIYTHQYMVQLKHTKNIDYFVVYVLPYLEIYLNSNPTEIIELCISNDLCDILNIMFDNNIRTHSIKNINQSEPSILELDSYLSRQYDLTQRISITKPLYLEKFAHLKSKEFICIYPKNRKGDMHHNITQRMLEDMLTKNKLNTIEQYIVGNPLDRLNTHKFSKDIKENIDMLYYLKHCKLFITSESAMHYIALLCNCRNVLIYSTRHDGTQSVDDIINYNPFNSNILVTNDLLSHEVTTFIENAFNI